MKSTKSIDESGTIRYHNDKGEYHREDGPAVEWFNGDKYWIINGERHREDGPAVEYSDGYKVWYLNGKDYTEEDYNQEVFKKRLERFKNL